MPKNLSKSKLIQPNPSGMQTCLLNSGYTPPSRPCSIVKTVRRPALLSGASRAPSWHMKSFFSVLFAVVVGGLAAGAADSTMNVSVLDNAVLCVRASRVPENVKDQIHAATVPGHLTGTVLDLRFADDAATNAADYFEHRKSPLVVLINSQTRGAAAALAIQLRNSASAVLIGSTNGTEALLPDIVVSSSPDEEKKFQENPFLKTVAPTAARSRRSLPPITTATTPP